MIWLLVLFAWQRTGALTVEVRSAGQPVAQVELTVRDQTAVTDDKGLAVFQIEPGDVEVTAQRYGFAGSEP